MNTKQLSKGTRRARRNLALKIALEQPFIGELNTYFNKIRKTAINRYKRNTEFLTSNQFDFGTEAVLTKQYRRVSRAFKDEMRLFLNTEKAIEIKQTEQELEATVNTALSVFIPNAVNASSREIDSTTTDDISKSFLEASLEITEGGNALSTNAVSTLASLKMAQKFSGRISTIALTETQNAAEATKIIEAAAMSSKDDENSPIIDPATGIAVGTLLIRKTWNAILDQVTRQSHVLANGQVRPLIEPFVVQGELLPYPGSSALGASASNVINCRCSATYNPI